MIQKVILFFYLLGIAFCTNGQNSSKENPIAFKYLLKHFELKENVKAVTTYGSSNHLMVSEEFDTDGRLSIYTSFSGMSTKSHYSYDKSKRIITISQQSASLPALKDFYQYNSNNEVEFKLYKENDPLRKFEYKDNLLVKDSSANKFSKEKTYYSYYQYNSKGQLTKLMAYNGGDKLSREEVYSYGKNLVTIIGKAYWTIGRVDDYEKKNYYDTKGNLIKSTFTQNSKTETTEYKLDEQGNWIWKTGGLTRRIEYYGTASSNNIKVAKSDIKNSLSIFLNENFDNNNNKWTEWDNDGSSAKVIDGKYQYTVKQNFNYASWLGVPNLSNQTNDFAIETKVFLHHTETSHFNDSYWLLWGVGNGGKDYYTFGVFPKGKFQYGKQVNGVWDGKQGAMFSSFINIGANKSNVLRVEKQQDSITFFINGKKVYKTIYEAFNNTHAGIGYQLNVKKMLDIDYLKIFKGDEVNVVKVNAMELTSVLSPEPYESTYQNELRVANDYQARGLALAKYVDGLMVTTLSDNDKQTLLVKKVKEMIEIDFMGLHLMWMKIKNSNVPFVSKVINSKLTSEQKTALKDFNVYTVDEFVSNQNNKPKPIWPATMPKPGYGWGKTVSSDRAIVKVQPANSVINNNEIPLSKLVGIVFSYFDANTGKKTFCTVTGYNDRDNIYIEWHIKGVKGTVTYDALLDNKTGGTGFDVAEIITCRACSGKGTVTSTFSHTNDYQYTLGQKHTYTKTTTSNCRTCSGSGIRYQ